ncbi:6404_t:CDS:1 [Gigaspora rosea]|nr:6404_t:CDS:1 [Gigaspora rosea]
MALCRKSLLLLRGVGHIKKDCRQLQESIELKKAHREYMQNKWSKDTNYDNSTNETHEEHYQKEELREIKEDHTGQINDSDITHDTQSTDLDLYENSTDPEAASQKGNEAESSGKSEQSNIMMQTDELSSMKTTQNIVGDAEMVISVPQITPEIVKASEMQDRDELSILGYGNPTGNVLLEATGGTHLALLIPVYDNDTEGFTLVSYRRHHEKRHSNPNKAKNSRKVPYGSSQGRGHAPRK